MKYKSVTFSINYKVPQFTFYISIVPHNLTYKLLSNEFLKKTILNIASYKPQNIFPHFTLTKKTVNFNISMKLASIKTYKKQQESYHNLYKPINYKSLISKELNIKNNKYELEKKPLKQYLKLQNTKSIVYLRLNKKEIQFDIFNSHKNACKYTKKTIFINMIYCSEKVYDIFMLKKYHNVEEYENDDEDFFIVEKSIVVTKSKKFRRNAIRIKKLTNELSLDYINNIQTHI